LIPYVPGEQEASNDLAARHGHPGQTDCISLPGYAERLIGSIRRECLDHIIVLGEVHLRHILQSYARYYNESERIDHWIRMRRSLAKFSE
jgi:hypothetical protein